MDSIKILFSFIGIFIGYLFDFFFFFLIRSVFDLEVIGQYGVIFSFLLLFSFILALGVETTYLTIIGKVKNSTEEKQCNGAFLLYRLIQFAIYTSIVTIFFFLFPVYNGDMGVFFLFFLGHILNFAAIHIFEFILISRKQIFKKNLISIIIKFSKILLLILLINLLNSSIWLLAFSNFISGLFFFALSVVFVNDLKISKPNSEILKKFLKFSYPFIISTSLMMIFRNIDLLLVNIWFPIEDVANYFTAKQIFDIFFSVFLEISFLLLTIFSQNISSGRIKQNIIIINKTHKILNFFIVPFVFLTIIYSTEIIVFIFGKQYEMTGVLLSIFSLNLIILSFDLGNKAHIRALEEVKFVAVMAIFQNSLSLVLAIVFIIPDFLNMGALGGAVSSIIALIISQLILRPIIYKKFGLGFYWGSFRNLAIMLGVFFIQIYINNSIYYPIYLVPLFILFDISLYFTISYLFKGISKENISFILTTINLKNIKATIFSELYLD